MVFEIGRRFRNTKALKILRRTTHDATDRTNLHGSEIRVGEMANTHCHVDTLLNDVDRSIDEQRLRFHGGIGIEVVGYDRKHVHLSEQRGRSDG